MLSSKSPVFRKVVIPWYRSKTAYALAIISLLLVFLFALAGISVAREVDRYNGYLWVPALLAVLSGSLIVTVAFRLIRRIASR
jgi:hypothetical protein